jgi:geranylgeranyl diphosphate synthase, type II
VYGDPEKFGKQIGGDIIANKKTYLLLKLQELAHRDDLNALAEHALNTTALPDKIDNITALYDEYSVKELATEQMRQYLDKAFLALDNIKVPETQKKELVALANALMHRES